MRMLSGISPFDLTSGQVFRMSHLDSYNSFQIFAVSFLSPVYLRVILRTYTSVLLSYVNRVVTCLELHVSASVQQLVNSPPGAGATKNKMRRAPGWLRG